ncbi:phycobilisome protein [Leptolyngbya sp. FACHB-261]|uniref:phycobilisome protein n=1 Tax=Leptolyngbya sp. FACHB-261 TaxID=2692806 RepID=UPI00168696FD|nr:phycobilisome protein [Leptolyngbya sp. FACHB-261]MBD2100555.1 phycobilisome protein [Leptolyngbya sp. FACHB-261]
MLSKTLALTQQFEGRYLRDSELDSLARYARELEIRTQTYQRLQVVEAEVIAVLESTIQKRDPSLFLYGREDATQKWRRDTRLTYRLIAKAVLLDDAEGLESFLLWMQTVMRAFRAQRCCDATYALLEAVLLQQLRETELALVAPFVRSVRQTLGAGSYGLAVSNQGLAQIDGSDTPQKQLIHS